MPKNRSQPAFDPIRAVKKLFLSGFVLVTFAAYVAYERLTKSDSALAASPVIPTASAVAPAPSGPITVPGILPTAASSLPTLTPAPTLATAYKNGTYQGQPVDAYYGLVQVQVSIQGGSIKDVQFLQYPNDRRTSQRINSIAIPYLQQEAIQAQSAQVDIISGATLTSEGFVLSLRSALQAAHN
jgi:uncharacterized protein with FMN-binding domain